MLLPGDGMRNRPLVLCRDLQPPLPKNTAEATRSFIEDRAAEWQPGWPIPATTLLVDVREFGYHPKHGYQGKISEAEAGDDNEEMERLRKRVAELEEKLTQNQTASPSTEDKA